MDTSVLAITENSDLPETMLFIALHRAGLDLLVMTPNSAPHRHLLIEAGVRVQSLELSSRIDFRGRSVIDRELERGSFEIVHVFNNKALQNVIPLLKKSGRGGIKLVAYRGIEGNLSVFDPISWMTYLNPRVDKIICVANAIRDYFDSKVGFLWWRFPKGKAVTIYKGHDLGWYRSPAIPRSTWGIPHDTFLVGCTVNERPRKGLPFLIDAMTALIEAGLNVHLLLIGAINGTPTLSKIENSTAKNFIHLTGTRKDAPQVLAACDACILPALKREGLPKGIIEGMVSGVTPIVTNTGGSRELINENCGIVIDAGSVSAIASAITHLASDEAMNEKMGEAARARIMQDFKAETTVEQTIALYRSLTRV